MSALTKALAPALKEIRLHFCQTSPASAGARNFIHGQYAAIKAANPDLKVLIREAAGVQPRAFARFERGVESQVALTDLSASEAEKAVEQLVASGPK